MDVFRQFARLYALRNEQGGRLDPEFQKESREVTFTLDSIFSGLYRSDSVETDSSRVPKKGLRRTLPVNFLRVPTDADVLCETTNNFFSGKLGDISTGGAYVQSPVPFRIDSQVRLTFCTFRDRMPLELEARIAWSNPSSIRKHTMPEGAGMQFVGFDDRKKEQLQDYIYELVEETLTRANLI